MPRPIPPVLNDGTQVGLYGVPGAAEAASLVRALAAREARLYVADGATNPYGRVVPAQSVSDVAELRL